MDFHYPVLDNLANTLNRLLVDLDAPFKNVRVEHIVKNASQNTTWYQIVAYDKQLELDYQLLDQKQYQALISDNRHNRQTYLIPYALKLINHAKFQAEILHLQQNF